MTKDLDAYCFDVVAAENENGEKTTEITTRLRSTYFYYHIL